MPSHGEQPQTTYHPTPLPPPYAQAPAQPHYGQHVVPLPPGAVVYPTTPGIDSVVAVPGPNGQQVAYYTPPPVPEPQPLVSPLLVKAALVAFIVGAGGVGVYFLALVLVELVKWLVVLGIVLVGGTFIVVLFSSSSGGSTSIKVNARGRAKVQIHTGRGHNRRGRR